MNTHGLIYADRQLIEAMAADATLRQLAGVAALPGIVGPALAMPDAHQGYGFPIGGVAAFDPDQGVVSPGGVGYDINCGVRLLRSRLGADDLSAGQLTRLADDLAAGVPAGVGRGSQVQLSDKDMDQVLARGAAWAVAQGYGDTGDLEFCEAGGALSPADPQAISPRARQRGRGQLGSLGAGNHFVELARVEHIYNQAAADAFGLTAGGLVVWIHSGSRGLGHQVCDDFLRRLAKDKEAVHPPERQLVAAPAGSSIGRQYVAAMGAAANFAFANRQLLTHRVRETMFRSLAASPRDLGLGLIYDIAHNIAKLEEHITPEAGEKRRVWVHRKGATRSLGPQHPEVPSRYSAIGLPVLLPGDMGTASYVLAGTTIAEAETFGSAAHGAGRRLSRKAAKKQAAGRDLAAELAQAGVVVRSHSRGTLAEEMPAAYKDVAQVARVMDAAGIARLVARTVPLVVIKG